MLLNRCITQISCYLIFVVGQCPVDEVMEVVQDHKLGVFSPLTEDEMNRIHAALQDAGFITAPMGKFPLLNSSYISGMSIYIPNKNDVLSYLDQGGPVPER